LTSSFFRYKKDDLSDPKCNVFGRFYLVEGKGQNRGSRGRKNSHLPHPREGIVEVQSSR
jgi:hypothetical protein